MSTKLIVEITGLKAFAGHAGRPGEVGGSLPKGAVGRIALSTLAGAAIGAVGGVFGGASVANTLNSDDTRLLQVSGGGGLIGLAAGATTGYLTSLRREQLKGKIESYNSDMTRFSNKLIKKYGGTPDKLSATRRAKYNAELETQIQDKLDEYGLNKYLIVPGRQVL